MTKAPEDRLTHPITFRVKPSDWTRMMKLKVQPAVFARKATLATLRDAELLEKVVGDLDGTKRRKK